MTSIIDTLDFEDRLVAEVRHDPDCPSPVADDEGVEIVILHNRYADPSEGRLGRTGSDVERWRKENRDEWFSINLWAYDHSGVVYRAAEENPFTVDREWDTAQAGIVALKRSEWGDGNLSDEELSKRAAQIAETYSDWAAGQCFSFVLRDADGAEIASADGIIGWDILRTGSSFRRPPACRGRGIRCVDHLNLSARMLVSCRSLYVNRDEQGPETVVHYEPKGEKPSHIDDHYLKWSIPTHIWSGEQYGEDELVIRYYFGTDEWTAHTEMDQCIKRDIFDEDIEAIRKEFGLDAWVEYYQPEPKAAP